MQEMQVSRSGPIGVVRIRMLYVELGQWSGAVSESSQLVIRWIEDSGKCIASSLHDNTKLVLLCDDNCDGGENILGKVPGTAPACALACATRGGLFHPQNISDMVALRAGDDVSIVEDSGSFVCRSERLSQALVSKLLNSVVRGLYRGSDVHLGSKHCL